MYCGRSTTTAMSLTTRSPTGPLWPGPARSASERRYVARVFGPTSRVAMPFKPVGVRTVRVRCEVAEALTFWTVRKVSLPGAVEPAANEATSDAAWAPWATWPPSVTPEPRSHTTYWALSATMGWPAESRADMPTRPGPRPPGDDASNTSTVTRLPPPTVTER